MRTTLDLPDALLRAARAKAAQQDETLDELVMRALVRELRDAPSGQSRSLPVIGSKRPAASMITPAELEQIASDDDFDRLA